MLALARSTPRLLVSGFLCRSQAKFNLQLLAGSILFSLRSSLSREKIEREITNFERRILSAAAKRPRSKALRSKSAEESFDFQRQAQVVAPHHPE